MFSCACHSTVETNTKLRCVQRTSPWTRSQAKKDSLLHCVKAQRHSAFVKLDSRLSLHLVLVAVPQPLKPLRHHDVQLSILWLHGRSAGIVQPSLSQVFILPSQLSLSKRFRERVGWFVLSSDGSQCLQPKVSRLNTSQLSETFLLRCSALLTRR